MNALVNDEAERTVLGCTLSDSGSLYRVLPLLKAVDFALDSHRRIYHAIADLAEAGEHVDELTVTDALIAKGQLESVGGVAYVSSLTYNVDAGLARVTNVEHYAELVLDKSRRRQARAAGACLAAATEDPSVPTDECLRIVQDSLLQIEATSGKTAARHVKDFMPEVLRELETQAQNQGLVGMTTGIHSLDLATGGIRAGELWTIGALPGKGKTALGVQIILANGAARTPTYAFSLEMQDLEIGKRFLAAKSSLPAIQIRNPQAIRRDRWPELLQTAAEVAECPIYVDDRPSLKIQELLASARLYIRRHGVKLIVVDYLRLVDAPGRELRDRVGYVANALRQLAKSERVGVVLLSQLRRPEGINARPSMLDLKESGDIEAHSHVVLLPFLPVGDDGGPIPDEQMLIIGKNRNGGIGSLPVYFDERHLFRQNQMISQRPQLDTAVPDWNAPVPDDCGIVLAEANTDALTIPREDTESMARRRYQNGSVKLVVQKTGAVWVGRWREDVIAPEGRPRRICRKQVLGTKKQFATEKLALRELAKRLAPINSLSYRALRTATFAQFADYWGKNVLPRHRRSTQTSFRSHLKKWLLPYFGQYAMKDVGTRVLQMFIDKAAREGLSWKSRQNVIKTLVSMWETARACDYVQPDNDPFRGLVLGNRGLVNVFSLSIQEIRCIVTAAPEPYRTFYWIIAETGIRCGEGCGLPISNIDIDNRVLYIRQKVWRGKIEPVKSKKGNRSFDISLQLAEHLRQFLESWRPNASGLLFATGKGTPWDPDTVRQRKFHPLLKKLKIQQCGFHAFRHGNATVLDKLHTPMALRQERLGHEDPKTTMGYTHVVTEDGRRIAEELGKLLAPSELRPAVMQSAGTA